ncbi:hypothetical protein CR513_12915, partial [Mucuna pruriens]
EPRRSSTKGSCVAHNPSGEDTHTELYVDEKAPNLVATRKVYKLGLAIHHQKLDGDHVRVIRDVDARVLVPTDEA